MASVPLAVEMHVLSERKKEKKDTMKITLNLDCRLFLCIFGCDFVLLMCSPRPHYHYQKEGKIPPCMTVGPTETHFVTGH